MLMTRSVRYLIATQLLNSDLRYLTGEQLINKLLSWLSPPDPFINYNTANDTHHEGTGMHQQDDTSLDGLGLAL